MSKFLVIYAHPTKEGGHAYFLNSIEEKLKKQAADYEIIDLYRLSYQPVLSSDELYSAGHKFISPENKAFQEKITASDRLIFIYPTWWQNMPAILKGFIDRVFVGGFGFQYKNGLPVGLLQGKKAAVFSATGGPRFFTKLFTCDLSTRILAKHVLRFCGIKTKTFGLGSMRQLDDKTKMALDKQATKTLNYLR